MGTTVKMWGRGLGNQIPKALAGKVGLKIGSKVEFDIGKGVLTLRPLPRRRRPRSNGPSIKERLANFKGPSPYQLFDRDPPVGRELI